METQTLHDVSPDDVDQVVADFESEGYTVTRQRQSNGNYTVVATRQRPRGASTPIEGNTVVLNNVKKKDVAGTVSDLISEGYTVTVQPEPDGEFTIIGVKQG